MKKKASISLKSFPTFLHLLAIVAVVIILRVSFYAATDGFSLYKIKNTFPESNEWQLPAPKRIDEHRIKSICEKPFSYLAKGSQAYAFISDDGQYVLKLFKCYHLTPVNWLENVPLPQSLDTWRDETISKRQKKITSTLNSYKIADTILKKECGIIAMSILPTTSLQQNITIIDKIGRHYTLNLADYGFILQKKASLIYPSMAQWIQDGNISQAKQALSSIVDLVIQRSKKGIQDSDPDLHKNAGLIGAQAVFIDVGSFHKNPDAKNPLVYKQDLLKITNNLKNWLHAQSPELALYLEEEINKKST